jgi:tetratricopeptide (TPR) repeat protein
MHIRARRTTVAGILGAIVLSAAGTRPAGGAAPPPAAGKLSAEQQARLDGLRRAVDSAAVAGKMGEALRLAREVEDLRRRWQGPGHWQATDARYMVERLRRLAPLSAEGQKQAGQAERLSGEANALYARGRFAEAEKAHRAVLAIRKELLGEEHRDTAASYAHVARCLDAQGRHAQAQPLFEKALDLGTKVLGELHPDTAANHANLGSCLHAQGKFAEARPRLEKALAVSRKVLGEVHPQTASNYSNMGVSVIVLQGKRAEALPFFEKALAIRRKALGEMSLDTADSYRHVAFCLTDLGRHAQALPLNEKALAARKRLLGEWSPDTAQSYSDLARSLNALRHHAQALPLYERALAVRTKVLGEDHPLTAFVYGEAAICLGDQGQYARALPLAEKALAIRKRVLGEQHRETARSYNIVAVCLDCQAKYAQAMPVYEKALALRRKAFGEFDANTALSYRNLAFCLQRQGRHGPALPLHERALAIYKKVLGEEHPDTAASYSAVGMCLNALGRPAQALPFCEKALAIDRKVRGEQHPDTAVTCEHVAGCLNEQGKHAEAQPLFEKALAVRRKGLGEMHPDTAESHCNLAGCLYAQGKHAAAVRHWQAALPGYEAGRLARASSGFDRALAHADRLTPRERLAVAHARLKEPALAWRHAEAGLARNLLDDRAGAAPEDAEVRNRLRHLDERLLPLFGLEKPTEDQERLRDQLARQRREVLAHLGKQAASLSADRVWPLERIQKQLPADAAVLLWLGGKGENWACVLRPHGPPRWVPLTGTGAKGEWTTDDYFQPERLHQALADAGSSRARLRELTEAVRQRWFAPLRPHLSAGGKQPAVRRVFVVPSGHMAALPAAVIAPEFVLSYTPSATLLAQSLAGHRPLKADPALALGDPIFQPTAPANPPAHGLLVRMVRPDGNADRAGLRAGDVLLRYDDTRLGKVDDLVAALKKNRTGKVVYWREGKEGGAALPGPLDVRLDPRPTAEAVRAWRAGNVPAARGERYEPLPGTRAEVRALRRLLGTGCRALLGSAASEQSLDELARKGELKRVRLLHLATHATVDLDVPQRSAVILSRDRLPGLAENAERARQGLRPYTGELTVDAVLNDWRLDADLVVLSACRTGLGRQTSGEGLLGFPYALLKAGARSVVLSRWKVDDTATALFMLRFYENLLGKQKELKKSLGKAEALAEAARWLRQLPRTDAERLAAALGQDKLSSTARGSVGELKLKEGEVRLPAGGRPYSHPYYWAAFTLLGDPD